MTKAISLVRYRVFQRIYGKPSLLTRWRGQKWEDITPLARNEWICWVISVKKPETRRQHIERVRTRLKEGMRRPCCWPGCPHR